MIFFTEIHKSLSRICFQMKDVQGRLCIVRSVKCSAQFRVLKHGPGSLQLVCSMDAVVNRLSFFYLSLEKFYIS